MLARHGGTRAEAAQLITADAAGGVTSFIAASDSQRGAWAASAQPSRSMTLNDYTSNGAEVEFLVWKKTAGLTRATSLQELYHGGRSLFAIRHEAEAAAASGAQQFKKSCMLLGTQPAPVKLAFTVCTPRVAKQLLRQYELAEMMTCTVVSDTELDVQWNDGHSDHARRPRVRTAVAQGAHRHHGGHKGDESASICGVRKFSAGRGEMWTAFPP